MIAASKPIATEASHWYLPDGTPFYEVPNKSKPGEMRPATIRDSRKVGAVPSVTTILQCVANPGLRRYFDRMMWEGSVTTPRLPDETDDEHFARCSDAAAEHSRNAREAGTAVHGAIEKWLSGERPPHELSSFVDAARDALGEAGLLGRDMSSERSFADTELFYGGKVDLHGHDWVVDFKTFTGESAKGRAYDSYGMQLVAYGRGLKIERPRLLNVFISINEPGTYHVHEWPTEEHDRLWRMFSAIKSYWRAANDY